MPQILDYTDVPDEPVPVAVYSYDMDSTVRDVLCTGTHESVKNLPVTEDQVTTRNLVTGELCGCVPGTPAGDTIAVIAATNTIRNELAALTRETGAQNWDTALTRLARTEIVRIYLKAAAAAAGHISNPIQDWMNEHLKTTVRMLQTVRRTHGTELHETARTIAARDREVINTVHQNSIRTVRLESEHVYTA